MRAFLLWLAIVSAIMGGTGVGLHTWLQANPIRILVAVDSSYSMKEHWPAVKRRLGEIERGNRYAKFALVTDKGRVHEWQRELTLGTTLSYGPRQFSGLANYAEYSEADQRILLTNAPQSDIATDNWRVDRFR